MLKTVSSITNALGAMNYKGTWNANTNTPTLASGTGAKGDYYVVSVAGTTTIDGISNWGIGDWAAFNGVAWQRLEGGADLNGVNLSVSGTSNLTGDVTFNNNIIQGTAAKGVNFTANTPAAGMTSQLLNWYEEGVSTVTLAFGGASTGITYNAQECRYTRIGNRVFIQIGLALSNKGSATGAATISGLPVTSKNVGYGGVVLSAFADNMSGANGAIYPFLPENSATIQLRKVDAAGNFNINVTDVDVNNTSYLMISGSYLVA